MPMYASHGKAPTIAEDYGGEGDIGRIVTGAPLDTDIRDV